MNKTTIGFLQLLSLLLKHFWTISVYLFLNVVCKHIIILKQTRNTKQCKTFDFFPNQFRLKSVYV